MSQTPDSWGRPDEPENQPPDPADIPGGTPTESPGLLAENTERTEPIEDRDPIEQPTSTGQPESTEQLASTEEPESTGQPESTEQRDPIEQSESTEHTEQLETGADETVVTPVLEPTAAQPIAWAPQEPAPVADAEPEPVREPAYAGAPSTTAFPPGPPPAGPAYSRYDQPVSPHEAGLGAETSVRRGIRVRTVILGLVLLATAGSVLVSQLTSITVDPGAVALAVMIGAGVLLLVAGARRHDQYDRDDPYDRY